MSEMVTVGIIEEGPRPKGNYLPRQRILKAEVARAISTSASQHPYYLVEELCEPITAPTPPKEQ